MVLKKKKKEMNFFSIFYSLFHIVPRHYCQRDSSFSLVDHWIRHPTSDMPNIYNIATNQNVTTIVIALQAIG